MRPVIDWFFTKIAFAMPQSDTNADAHLTVHACKYARDFDRTNEPGC